MKLYRNYDGKKSGFGETSVACAVPNPDDLSAFAAVRMSDRALTLVVINKQLGKSAAVSAQLGGFHAGGKAQAWQLTSANRIERVADAAVAGGTLSATVPTQSVTLYVIPER